MLAIVLAVFSADPVRLQGDWLMVERHYANGTVRKYPKGETTFDHFNLHVHGDRATIHIDWTDPDDEIVATFRAEAGKIDFTVVSCTFRGYKKGDRTLGLYKFEGDALFLCDADSEKRPAEFKSVGDAHLYKFVRAKKP